MKKNFFLVTTIFFFITISVKAQRPKEQRFSMQFNTGYTWFSGVKYKLTNTQDIKVAYGSFTNGQIPIELELRYKVAPKLLLDLAYSYGIGIPRTDVNSGISGTIPFTNKARTNLSTNTIRIGEVIYLSERDKIKPYIGLDIGILISKLTQQIDRTTTDQNSQRKIDYKPIITFGFFPKIGFEAQINKNVFLNVAVHYVFVVPVDISEKGANGNLFYPSSKQSISQGIATNVGIGYRF